MSTIMPKIPMMVMMGTSTLYIRLMTAPTVLDMADKVWILIVWYAFASFSIAVSSGWFGQEPNAYDLVETMCINVNYAMCYSMSLSLYLSLPSDCIFELWSYRALSRKKRPADKYTISQMTEEAMPEYRHDWRPPAGEKPSYKSSYWIPASGHQFL